jgi:ketosteroid isomerase-like protein
MKYDLNMDALENIKERIAGYYTGWGFDDGRAHSADARRFYAPDLDLVLYDTQPPVAGFSDTESLHRGVADRAAAAGIRSVIFAPALDQVQARAINNVVWTITPYRVTAVLPDGTNLSLMPTQTHVWERRDGDWLIVHEQTAPQAGYGDLAPTGETVVSLPGSSDSEAEEWVDRWLAAGGNRTDPAVRRVGLGVPPEGISVQRRGAVRSWRRPGVAWLTYLVGIDASNRTAIGRDSLVVATDAAGWQVLHTHRSVPFVVASGGKR